jgi:hypothetical protein
MRAPRGADSKRDATTNPNPDFIQPSNILVMPSDGDGDTFVLGGAGGRRCLLRRVIADVGVGFVSCPRAFC